MVKKSNRKHQNNFKLNFLISISSSLLITGYCSPANAVLNSTSTVQYRIAKTPDERIPEAVQDGIENIPAIPTPTQTPSPAPTQTPTPTSTQTPTPTPTQTPTQQTPTQTPTPTPTQQTPTQTPSPTPTPTPTQQTPNPTPTQQTPTQQTPNPTPTQQTPTQQTPNPTPTQQTPSPTPTQQTPSPTPTQQTPNPRPTQQTPTQQTPNPAPTQQTPTRTPSRQPSPPTQQRIEPQPVPIPSPRRSTPPPTQQRIEPQPVPIPSPRRSTPPPTQQRIEPQPVPIPSPRRSTPLPQQSPIKSPISISSKPNFKKINFVEIELGVLAPNDYKYQGKYYDFYQFEGRENQLIQLRMIGSDDKRDSSNLSLNPVVMLLDSDNKVIAVRSNRNTSEDVNDAFMFVRLPSKGTYTIAVTSKNPGDIGRYSLAMRNDRASYTLDEFGMLTQQKPILKQNRTAYNVSQFQGSKGQLISIRADSNYEQFSPYIVLLNSKGEIVASDNAKDGKYSALIDRVELPDNGTYYVVVTSSTSKKTGTYRLSIF